MDKTDLLNKFNEIGKKRKAIMQDIKLAIESNDKQEVFKQAMILCATKPTNKKDQSRLTKTDVYMFISRQPEDYLKFTINPQE